MSRAPSPEVAAKVLRVRSGTPPGNRTLLPGFGDQARPRRRRRETSRRSVTPRQRSTTGRTRTLADDVRSVASHPRDGGRKQTGALALLGGVRNPGLPLSPSTRTVASRARSRRADSHRSPDGRYLGPRYRYGNQASAARKKVKRSSPPRAQPARRRSRCWVRNVPQGGIEPALAGLRGQVIDRYQTGAEEDPSRRVVLERSEALKVRSTVVDLEIAATRARGAWPQNDRRGEGPVGIEPTSRGLTNRRSATELRTQTRLRWRDTAGACVLARRSRRGSQGAC